MMKKILIGILALISTAAIAPAQPPIVGYTTLGIFDMKCTPWTGQGLQEALS
jgi:hypothetical protein